ncbi:MAG: hypothetical protein KTR31_28205 [Myxococcales bacterium]|nr:hypothetical protein [Myxococcales bacterium]
MSYVAAEILLLCVLLSLVSAVIGWVTRAYAERWWFAPRAASEALDASTLREELERARSQLRDLDQRLARMEPERVALEEDLARKEAMIAALQEALEGEPPPAPPPAPPDDERPDAVEEFDLIDEDELPELADFTDEADPTAESEVMHAEVTSIPTTVGFPVVVPPVSTLTREQAQQRVRSIALEIPVDETDDLRAVRGIGARMAEQLEEMKVVTYRQLVVLVDKQPELMAKALKSTEGRVTKWATQARRLHESTYGEALP